MNTGNQDLKAEWRERFDAQEYDTPFWNIIHELSFRAVDAQTHHEEAIVLLIDIAERLIEGLRAGRCDRKDLYYAMKLFGDLDMIYSTSGELYDFCGGELYHLMQRMEAGMIDIDELQRAKRALHAELGLTEDRRRVNP